MSPNSLKIIQVLDINKGGEEVLIELAGKDATDAFEEIGHSPDSRELLKKFYVGDVDPKEVTTKAVPESRKVKQYPGQKS
jgi:cytochrome b involved in lipid metabolism